MNLDLAILSGLCAVLSLIVFGTIVRCDRLHDRIDELEFEIELLKESEKP